MTDLVDASRQWAKRGPDERFKNLTEAFKMARIDQDTAIQPHNTADNINIRVTEDDVLLCGANREVPMTNFAIGQLCTKIRMPMTLVARQPVELAQDNFDWAMEQFAVPIEDKGIPAMHMLLQDRLDGMICRSITSGEYSRVFDAQILDRLIGIKNDTGFVVPPARWNGDERVAHWKATEDDVLKSADPSFWGSVRIGDDICASGIYRGDRSMFVFMVDDGDLGSVDDGSDGGLRQGFFVINSEVGDCAFKIIRFLYRHVCGNHIVWDAQDICEVSYRHRGAIWERVQKEMDKLAGVIPYDDSERLAAETKIKLLKSKRIVDPSEMDKDEAIKAMAKFCHKNRDIDIPVRTTVKVLEGSDEWAEVDGDPWTPWGLANAFTRYSQTSLNGDARTELDMKAGALLTVCSD